MIPTLAEGTVLRAHAPRFRKYNQIEVLLFRVMEIHRINEVTATPESEGAHLSE